MNAGEVRQLYVGVWQVTRGSTPQPIPPGLWLSVSTGRHASPSSRGVPIGACFTGVEYVTTQDHDSHSSMAAECSRLLEVIQCAGACGASRMQLSTHSAMYVGHTPVGLEARTARGSAAQGMLRAAASECPMLGVGALDSSDAIPYAFTPSQRSAGLAMTQRLLPSAAANVPGEPAPCTKGGLYVLSGGLGSLGLLVAQWLASSEVGHVWLLGRSGRLAGDSEALQGLWQGSACVAGRRCDLSSAEEAAGVASGPKPLHGFMHAGGVLQDAIVANMTLDRCRAVFAPKLPGLCNMELCVRTAPMDGVVLFSSIASLLGGVGQANYTAANAALDATAGIQQAQGVASSSVQWGTWVGGGMALRDASTLVRAEKVGIGMVLPDVGLAVVAAFMRDMRNGGAHAETLQVGVASPFVWSTFLQRVADPGIFSEYHAGVQAEACPITKTRRSRQSKASRKAQPRQRQEAAAGLSSAQKEALCSQPTTLLQMPPWTPLLASSRRRELQAAVCSGARGLEAAWPCATQAHSCVRRRWGSAWCYLMWGWLWWQPSCAICAMVVRTQRRCRWVWPVHLCGQRSCSGLPTQASSASTTLVCKQKLVRLPRRGAAGRARRAGRLSHGSGRRLRQG